MKQAPAPSDLVFVVHGANVHTWWRRLANGGYAWWRSWSLFSDAIRIALAGDVEIREVRWSGSNTHQARLTAGEALAGMIGAQPADARIHLVTHSHGGNVALVAVNHLPPGRVASLVLLANPHMTLAEERSVSAPYWGAAHSRVARIWNLFSEKDFIQTRGAALRHGFAGPTSRIFVHRTYEGPGKESVYNHAIDWNTLFGAHRAMHCSAMGHVCGRLLHGDSFPQAMAAAGLSQEAPNDIPDRGGFGGTAWAFQRIRERANPAPFDVNSANKEIVLLLVHGFTASPSEMKPLADSIGQRTGWRCKAILLPGHGTLLEDMDQTSATAWLDSVQTALAAMAKESARVFLIGLSLGAVLCCLTAANRERPANLAGIALLAPAFGVSPRRELGLRILRLFRKRRSKGPRAAHYFLEHKLFSYPELHLERAAEVLRLGRQAWKNLDKLKGMPTLLIAGDLDRNVSTKWMIAAADRHPWIELVRLRRSRHILTVEPDRETAFEAILSFIRRSAVAG